MRMARVVLACCVALLVPIVGTAQAPPFASATPGYVIELPRDEGSHPDFRTEWWYLTGWLEDSDGASFGFQVTFFRHRPGFDEANPSQFAAKQLLFAHASLSDPDNGRLRRAEKVARAGFGLAEAREGALDVHIDAWSLRREGDAVTANVSADDFRFEVECDVRQELLLHGRDGFSQKTPDANAASHYYSLPQLVTRGRVWIEGKAREVNGIAWLDHEWFGSVLDPKAQGWDWTGLNFEDGSTLMALQMRDEKGDEYWAAATLRDAKGATRTFNANEIEWQPIRRWRSPRTGVEYPVEVSVRVGDRTLRLLPLLDDQENDARGSTGTIYWEGAMRAFESGKQVGRGYLEMTGYGERIRF